MKLSHNISFTFDLALPVGRAREFVRDVGASLHRARFLDDLTVMGESDLVVRAEIPVNAALFGQQKLPFASRLEPTPLGARLHALRACEGGPGWAEVSGEAEVHPLPTHSRVTYDFRIVIHLDLPEPERWGGKALLRMIAFTAERVLERVSADFPQAVQESAREVEAAFVA